MVQPSNPPNSHRLALFLNGGLVRLWGAVQGKGSPKPPTPGHALLKHARLGSRSLGSGGLLALALLLPVTACSSAQTSPKTQAQLQADAARAYAEAELEFEQHNWEYARQLMDDVRRNYSYTPYARKAQLKLADIAYEQDRLPEAVTEYQAYVHDHPNDAEVPYARLRVIRSHFEESKGTMLQPPVEERDLGSAREAYTEVRAFLADYPNYEPRAELVYIREAVSGLLARHELYVARFYLQQDRLNAALRRVQHCLRSYDASGLEPEAEVLLGETYLRMKEPRRARALFEHVRAEYPISPFVTVAENFLRHLDESSRSAIGETALAPVP